MRGEPWIEMAHAWGLPPVAIDEVIDTRIGAVRWRHAQPEFPDMAMPVTTLCYQLRPSRSFLHRGGRTIEAAVAAGGVGLLPRGSHGRWTFCDPVDVLHVMIPDELLAELAGASDRPHAPAINERLTLEDPVLAALLGEVAGAMRNRVEDRLYVDLLGATIGMRLIRKHSDHSGQAAAPAAAPAGGGLAPWQQRRVTEYLRAHLARNITLAQLSELAQLSPFHFARMFKRSTGLPPHAFLRTLRAARARELLESTTLSIIEIALEVGYESSQALARAFRRETGVSPTEYRRERRP